MVTEDPAVNWLLESGDPSIIYLTLTDILDRPSDSKEVLAAKRQIAHGADCEDSSLRAAG
jgi:hypothetical protein